MVTSNEIETKLKNKLDAVHVEAVDESDGCGAKFTVLVVSDQFEGKSLIQRHRMVNEALKEELQSIHAFSQKPITTAQWENTKQ